MKTLSIQEMNNVSGAYSWNSWTSIFSNTIEAIASATLGGAAGFAAGAAIGGKHGGDGAGILGVGVFNPLIGMICAGIVGGVAASIGGAIVGFNSTAEYSKKFLDGLFNGTFVP